MMENNKTLAWRLYELGRDYNEGLTPNQYTLVETNTEFFSGNQWLHLPQTRAMNDLPKPTFNILKRIASLFIASLTSSGVALRFEPLAYYDGSNMEDPQHDAAAVANAEVRNLLEKFKFDYRLRDALFDGASTGDYCAHFYWDADALPYGGAFGDYRGEVKMELVDGINVHFGNPESRVVEDQPYILIVGRDTVDHLAWEAERFQKNKGIFKSGKASDLKKEMMKDAFQPDYENEHFPGVGGKHELHSTEGNGKALYVLLYTKVTKEVTKKDPKTGEPIMEPIYDEDGFPVYETAEDGQAVMDAFGMPIPKTREAKEVQTSIHVTKATRSQVIYENVDTGLSKYPIAWGCWEKQKNQYHGRALVTGLIANQIFLNTQFAMSMQHMRLMAYPKTVYNADLIPKWDNRVGQAIGIHGLQPGQAVSQVAYNLQPAEMSNQAFTMIDKTMEYTKEVLGATDAQMGQANPENTSALMVLQTNAEVPLENIRSNLYEWVEDIGEILLDMVGTYYGERPVIMDREFDEPVMGPGGMPQLDPMTGTIQSQKIVRKIVETFDFNQFKNLFLNMKLDVGATTYYSEIAMTQTLDNLRKDGTLDVIQYLERIPDKLIPKKQELVDELRGRIAEGQQANAAAGAAIPEPGSPMQGQPQKGEGTPQNPTRAAAQQNQTNTFNQQGLSGAMAANFDKLPDIAKKTALQQGDKRIF